MKKKWEVRYFVTDVASVPICKTHSKTEAYKQAAKPGWGTVEWYSAEDGYKNPTIRDRNDKTQHTDRLLQQNPPCVFFIR